MACRPTGTSGRRVEKAAQPNDPQTHHDCFCKCKASRFDLTGGRAAMTRSHADLARASSAPRAPADEAWRRDIANTLSWSFRLVQHRRTKMPSRTACGAAGEVCAWGSRDARPTACCSQERTCARWHHRYTAPARPWPDPCGACAGTRRSQPRSGRASPVCASAAFRHQQEHRLRDSRAGA